MKRRVLITGTLISATLAICVVYVIAGCKNKDIIVMSAKATNGESARIVAYNDSILGTYAADLVCLSANGSIIKRRNLIRSRDSIEDVRIEFYSLDFKGDEVVLGAKGTYYHGTNVF